MSDLFSVDGKVVVITGGSRGIGAMMSKGFLERGAKVIITSRKEPELFAAQAELSAYGEVLAYAGDISTLAGIQHFASKIRETESKIDVLINNAGASWGAPVKDFPEAGWDKIMDVNVKSLFFLTQELLPELTHQASRDNPARVINIASVNGMTNAHLTNYSYSAAKAGVIHLSKHLSSDLAADHINVNAISPGFFPSKMTEYLIGSEQGDEILVDIPKGRFGEAEDIVGAAIYLSSAASKWVTGINLPVDGGLTANA